jgi:hypothetical protein
MNDKDVSSSQVPYSREVLCDELKNDRPTILNVDAKDLHPATDENGDSILTGWEGNAGGGHAVTAVDGQFDDQGKLTKVLISDTGNGINGMQYWMKIEDLEIAIDNNPGALAENRMRAAANQPLERSTINVINHPIKTDCP